MVNISSYYSGTEIRHIKLCTALMKFPKIALKFTDRVPGPSQMTCVIDSTSKYIELAMRNQGWQPLAKILTCTRFSHHQDFTMLWMF